MSLPAASRPPAERGTASAPSAMDRRVERRLFTPARIAAATAVVAFVGAAASVYVKHGSARALQIDDQRITTARVAYGTFREYIPVTGTVAPRMTYYLDAVEGGQVTDVYVEAGAVVEMGDPLVRLKNTNLQLQVISAEAQLTEQLNHLSSTQLQLEQNLLRHRRELIEIDYRIDQLTRELARVRPLLGPGGALQSQVDDLEAELAYLEALREAVAEAQVLDERSQRAQIDRLQGALDAMNGNLGIARENLNNLVITAPISGQLTMLEANTGESKAPGQRVGQIDELNAFRISAFIDEFYLGRVALGQSASAEIAGAEYALEVAKIYPGVSNRQFEVDFEFVGIKPGQLRRGQSVRVQLEIGHPAETLVLRNGPFYSDAGGLSVFVVDAAGELAVRRNVRFGRRNPEMLEVIEGLEEGEEVITSSYQRFNEFDIVRFDGRDR